MPFGRNTPRGAGRREGLYLGPYINETADDVNPLPPPPPVVP
jgi:hypothetical protein